RQLNQSGVERVFARPGTDPLLILAAGPGHDAVLERFSCHRGELRRRVHRVIHWCGQWYARRCSASTRTVAPRAASSALVYSAALCELPSTLGTNNIAVGTPFAMTWLSWPAPLIMGIQRTPHVSAAARNTSFRSACKSIGRMSLASS